MLRLFVFAAYVVKTLATSLPTTYSTLPPVPTMVDLQSKSIASDLANECNAEYLYFLLIGPVIYHLVFRFLTDPFVQWATRIWIPDQPIEKQKIGKYVVKFIGQSVAFLSTFPCVVLVLSRPSLKLTLPEYQFFQKAGSFYLSVYLWEFGHDSNLKWPSFLHHLAVIIAGGHALSGVGTAEHILGILMLVSLSQTMIYSSLLMYYFGVSKARLSKILLCTIIVKTTAIIGVQVWGVTFMIINASNLSAFVWKISLQILIVPAHIFTLKDLCGIRRKTLGKIVAIGTQKNTLKVEEEAKEAENGSVILHNTVV